jgi:hypothetical protein
LEYGDTPAIDATYDPQLGRTHKIRRLAAILALILLISLLGIAPVGEARRAAIGFSRYSPSQVTVEIPVDQRFVRRSVEPPTVRPQTVVARRTDGLAHARSLLASRISTYPILEGSTVEFGDTQGNPQGICFYQSGRIVINPDHTVSLERIIDHEIWHIIDWRDNGRIDWGENVPPRNAADYR